MRLVKYKTPSPVMNLFGDLENFFNLSTQGQSRINRRFSEDAKAVYQPATNFFEDKSSFSVELELPGFTKKEIELESKQGELHVSGSRKRKEDDSKSDITFKRSFSLPDLVDADKIGARLENGLLTITIPKAEEAKPVQITVQG